MFFEIFLVLSINSLDFASQVNISWIKIAWMFVLENKT